MDSQALNDCRSFHLTGLMMSDRCFANGTISIIEDGGPAFAFVVCDDTGNRSSPLVVTFDDIFTLRYHGNVRSIVLMVPFSLGAEWLVHNAIDVEVSQQDTISLVMQFDDEQMLEFREALKPIWTNFRSCSAATSRISMARQSICHINTTTAPAAAATAAPPVPAAAVEAAVVAAVEEEDPAPSSAAGRPTDEQPQPADVEGSSPTTTVTTNDNSPSHHQLHHQEQPAAAAPAPTPDVAPINNKGKNLTAAQLAKHTAAGGAGAAMTVTDRVNAAHAASAAVGAPSPIGSNKLDTSQPEDQQQQPPLMPSQRLHPEVVAAVRTPPFGARERAASQTPSRSPPRKRKTKKDDTTTAATTTVPPPSAAAAATIRKKKTATIVAKSPSKRDPTKKGNGTLLSIITAMDGGSKSNQRTPQKPAAAGGAAGSPGGPTIGQLLLPDPGTVMRRAQEGAETPPPSQDASKKKSAALPVNKVVHSSLSFAAAPSDAAAAPSSPFDFGNLDFTQSLADQQTNSKKRTRQGTTKAGATTAEKKAPRGAKAKAAAAAAAAAAVDEDSRHLLEAVAATTTKPKRSRKAAAPTAAAGEVAAAAAAKKESGTNARPAAGAASGAPPPHQHQQRQLPSDSQSHGDHLTRIRTALSVVPAGSHRDASVPMRAPSIWAGAAAADGPSVEEQDDLQRMLARGLDASDLNEFMAKSLRLVEKKREAHKQQLREVATAVDVCNKMLRSCAKSGSERRSALVSATTDKFTGLLAELRAVQGELQDAQSAFNTRLHDVSETVGTLTNTLHSALGAFAQGAQKMDEREQDDIDGAVAIMQEHFDASLNAAACAA